MKKFTTYLLFCLAAIVLANSCATTKQAYQKGNYYVASQRAIKHLHKNPSHTYQVDYLVESFNKYKQQTLQNIQLLEAQQTQANAESIWQQYQTLQALQNKIQLLLPLQSTLGIVKFEFENYYQNIADNKNTTLQYLYKNAENLLQKNNRFFARQAITYLEKINTIQPNYLQVNDLLIAAKMRAKTNVQVNYIPNNKPETTINGFAILSKIATNKLHNNFTNFYTTIPSATPPHYFVNYKIINYQDAPSKETEKTFVQYKNKIVAIAQKKDASGNPLKDMKGNAIMDTTFEKIQCTLVHTNIKKRIQCKLQIELQDATNGIILAKNEIPMEENFEYNYATYKGDKTALTDEQSKWIQNKKIEFPATKDMVETLVAKSADSIEVWLQQTSIRKMIL